MVVSVADGEEGPKVTVTNQSDMMLRVTRQKSGTDAISYLEREGLFTKLERKIKGASELPSSVGTLLFSFQKKLSRNPDKLEVDVLSFGEHQLLLEIALLQPLKHALTVHKLGSSPKHSKESSVSQSS